jgi:hypothetical protein
MVLVVLVVGVEELSDTAARVDIDDGGARWSINRDELGSRIRTISMESEYSGEIDRDDLVFEDTDYSGDEERAIEIEPFVIVVERDGGWYVSPFLTGMAWMAELYDVPEGDYDALAADDAGAAATPEEAVVALADSIDELDPDQTFESLPSMEFAMLSVYSDSIERFIDERIDNSEGFTFDVDSEDLVVSELPDGFRKVTIEQASGSFSTTDDDGYEESYDWELDGLCLTWDYEDGSDGGCLDDDIDEAAVEDLVDSFEIDAPFVVVEEDRGGWVVSPMATILQYGTEMLPMVTDAWAFRLLGLEPLAPADVTAEVDVAVEGVLNEAGYAVVDLPLEEGQTVAMGSPSGDFFTDVYDPALDYDYDALDGMPAEMTGTYRIVVWGEAGDDFGFTVSVVEVQDLPSSNEVSDTLPADQLFVAYRFEVDESGDYQLIGDGSDSSEFSMSVDDADGNYVCDDYSSICTLDEGEEYVLRIERAYGDDSDWDDIDYEVAVEPAATVTIDGSDRVSGSAYDGEESYHSVTVPSGVTAIISMTWDSTDDLDLHCADADVCTASMSTGPYEEIEITGPFDGEIYVYGFNGDGNYELTITEQ